MQWSIREKYQPRHSIVSIELLLAAASRTYESIWLSLHSECYLELIPHSRKAIKRNCASHFNSNSVSSVGWRSADSYFLRSHINHFDTDWSGLKRRSSSCRMQICAVKSRVSVKNMSRWIKVRCSHNARFDSQPSRKTAR